MHDRVAVLVDGGFFRERYKATNGGKLPADPKDLALALHEMALKHVELATVCAALPKGDSQLLYRIFYYDCPPLDKKLEHPVSGQMIDFSQLPLSKYMSTFFDSLLNLRKVALRLGRLSDFGQWYIKAEHTKGLIKGSIDPTKLTKYDVKYDSKQKGVDMKIGLDIATLAFKRLVGKIVLVAGDADFVPAAKLARIEGIDLILDPLWTFNVPKDLVEHIDGIRTIWPKPALPTKKQTAKKAS